ncbi:spore germination protein [Fodinisporobacter ferrooxydans]|uniref:Spore germination protein n=1 Tax=Fodinisporobacter ferrooxydans TaxID=2901836 RepID=A0ABY4CPG0_9BACL|nr:spore germination protein [Alicyclobacillaceae bacterium MYW30-H2]
MKGANGMIHEGHIGHREAIAVVSLYSVTKIFLSFPEEMVKLGGTASWQIPLLSGIWTAIFVFLIYRLYVRTEGASIFEVAYAYGGKFFGGLSSLIYTLFFLALGSLILREFTETVVATVLPGTPVSAVAIPFMLAILYIAYQGSEIFSRVGFIIAPIVFVGIAIIFLLNTNWMNPNYLLPIEGWGMSSVIYNSFFRTSMYGELFILVLLIPSFRKKQEFRKVCFWSLGISIVALTLTILCYLMIFSSEEASRLPFPMFQISRMIYLGRFLQRIESIFIFLWVSSAVIKVGVSLWGATFSFAEGIRVPLYKPLLFPMAILMYTLSFVPKNFPEAANWDISIFRLWGGLIPFGFIVILYMLTLVRKERGNG